MGKHYGGVRALSGVDLEIAQGECVALVGDNAVTVRETYVDYLGAQTQKEIEMRTRSTTQGG